MGYVGPLGSHGAGGGGMKASVASMWPVGVDRTALHGRYRKMPREPRLLDKIQASESPRLETQGGQLPRNDT